MSKLTLNDVKIIGEGPQIRNFIRQKCVGISEFYKIHKDEISMKYSGFRTTFSRDYINSTNFKCIITRLLNEDYNSLFVPIPKQIKSHVQSIYENIREYQDEDDQLTFDYLFEQCQKHNEAIDNTPTLIAMLYRAKARNYYYTNKINLCAEYYDLAIKALPKDEINKRVYFHCEFTDSLFRENMLEKADKKYKNLDIMVRIHMDKLDNTTLYYYHYWRGISYMFSNKNATAREFFIKAKDYAPRNFEKAGAIANIGLTLKRNKQYDEALKYYQDALNYPDESRIFTTAEVYNYIAMLYKAVKDYPNALDYIQKALDIAEKENNLTYKLAYTATYVEIQLEMGNIKNYKSYFNVLLSTKGKQIHSKPYMLKDIKSFIEYINDIPCLDELIDIIMDIRNVASSIEYKDGLAECVGHAEIKIRNLTRGV